MSNLINGLLSSSFVVAGGACVGKYVYDEYKRNQSLTNNTENMVELARKGGLRGRVLGRNATIEDLSCKLGMGKGIIVLHGAPGTGKTALIEEIAYRMSEGQIHGLKNARLLRLKTKLILPGQGVINMGKELLYGSMQSTVHNILEEIIKINKEQSEQTILFIDEIHKLFITNGCQYDFSVFDKYLEDLDRVGLIIVGATSDPNLVSNMQTMDPTALCPMQRRMKAIEVNEMQPQEVILALQPGREALGKERGVDL